MSNRFKIHSSCKPIRDSSIRVKYSLFGFTNMGSNLLHSRVTANQKNNFWSWTPCMNKAKFSKIDGTTYWPKTKHTISELLKLLLPWNEVPSQRCKTRGMQNVPLTDHVLPLSTIIILYLTVNYTATPLVGLYLWFMQ